jgi:hypothetical protein
MENAVSDSNHRTPTRSSSAPVQEASMPETIHGTTKRVWVNWPVLNRLLGLPQMTANQQARFRAANRKCNRSR